MYINPNSVGMKFELLMRRFKDALETEFYSESERKLISDAIDSLEYVKGFFAGTSKLPSLEEDASTTWGMTFDWLRRSYKNIEDAEQLIDQVAHLQELALENVNRKARQQESTEDLVHIPGLSFTDVPSFTPDPKVRAQILNSVEAMTGRKGKSVVGEVIDVSDAELIPVDGESNEDGLYEQLEYGLGMWQTAPLNQ